MSRKNGHTIPLSNDARECVGRLFPKTDKLPGGKFRKVYGRKSMPECCGDAKDCKHGCGWKYQCKAKQEYKEAKDV